MQYLNRTILWSYQRAAICCHNSSRLRSIGGSLLPSTFSTVNRSSSSTSNASNGSNSNSSSNPKKKEGKEKKAEGEGKYSKTVFLPQTSFDQRANSLKREPEIQKWWDANKIYEKLYSDNTGDDFVLHDGPPYANGDLHIGHALNKILKDIINRYQMLRGKKVRYVPGWDCHGLPIELKVLQSMKSSEKQSLNPITLRTKAAEFAQKTMASQRDAFKRYGIWGDWDHPYLTLHKEYEAAQIKVFGEMVSKGHIYRGKKPVHWSPSSKTALAEAELEYPDNHISKSIFVGFGPSSLSSTFESHLEKTSTSKNDVFLVIWTTTPWTIPANLAIAVNSNIEYCLISHPKFIKKMVVAKDLVPSFSQKMGLNVKEGELFNIESCFSGAALSGTKYIHPIYQRESEVISGGDYITTETGTGLVHTAPGHGQEDYKVGIKHNLPLLSPVDDDGKFTSEAGEDFVGLSVLGEGNTKVIEKLKSLNALLCEENYNHKYPYDWRTKKPTIFRATEQWFSSVSNFRDDVMHAINNSVKWVPAAGKNRISAMIESRNDWCISRQRAWGVPIPAFYHKQTNEVLMNEETIGHIGGVFEKHGSDAWWTLETKDLLPPGPLRDAAESYVRGNDTMDVWFDSGTSWAGVCVARGLKFPADLYLEGSDQHRGWFQSSLLTAIASRNEAPYKTVLTHGFVLDEKGYKMSKSMGNVVDPKTVIEGGSNQKESPAFGADTLRLWVAGVDYSDDVRIGNNIMQASSDNYRKIRNTLRFMVGSLGDFDYKRDVISYDKLPSVDKYMLGKLTQLVHDVEGSYDNYNFMRVVQAIQQFCNADLSAFYLDASKDRLYISSKNDIRRRSCQTVLYHALEQVAVMIAPILPHLAEDLWGNLPYQTTAKSIFMKGWVENSDTFPPHDAGLWSMMAQLRSDVNKCIDTARRDKLVGANNECKVFIYTEDESKRSLLRSMKGDTFFGSDNKLTNSVDDLRFLLIVSEVDIVDSVELIEQQCTHILMKDLSESSITVGVKKAGGSKCERCWNYCSSVGTSGRDICDRCHHIVVNDKLEGLINK